MGGGGVRGVEKKNKTKKKGGVGGHILPEMQVAGYRHPWHSEVEVG